MSLSDCSNVVKLQSNRDLHRDKPCLINFQLVNYYYLNNSLRLSCFEYFIPLPPPMIDITYYARRVFSDEFSRNDNNNDGNDGDGYGDNNDNDYDDGDGVGSSPASNRYDEKFCLFFE